MIKRITNINNHGLSDDIKFRQILLKNIKLNSPELNFLSCDICDYRTYTRYTMQRHMERHMNLVKNTFSCEVRGCGVQMSDRGSLRRHMRIHTGERPFSCTFESCDRRFVASTELKMHMRRHLGEKPYECDQCPAAFVNLSSLKIHWNHKHSDLRPFSCAQCDKSFKVKRAYKNHLVTHTDIPKYNCDLCRRSFRQLKSLRDHMNHHTGHRPYTCNNCGTEFHSSSAHLRHEKKCHKIK